MSSKKLSKSFAGVITGASTGIGRALAILLARKYRARLVLNARVKETLDQTAALVKENGGEALTITGDIKEKELPGKLVDACLTTYGDIDLLVNNAGLARPGSLTRLTPEDWEHVFAVNFFAALYGTYAALPHFLKKKRGKIVNVASVAGKVAFPGSVCYAASKFAMTGMSEGMGSELARDGIDVITVCPGWVRTEFFSKNKVDDLKNPTLIANTASLSGLIMKHFLSISSDECAQEIERALRKGGAHEIVLTGPGIIVERLHGILPGAMRRLASQMPMTVADTASPLK